MSKKKALPEISTGDFVMIRSGVASGLIGRVAFVAAGTKGKYLYYVRREDFCGNSAWVVQYGPFSRNQLSTVEVRIKHIDIV